MSATSTHNSGKDNKPTVRTVKRTLTPEQLDLRMWNGLTVVLAITAILAFIAYFLLAVDWTSRPFLGVMVSQTMTVSNSLPTTSEEWPGLKAGLQTGDEILAINAKTLIETAGNYPAALNSYRQTMSNLQAGKWVTVQFRRHVPVATISMISPENNQNTTEMLRCEADGTNASICTIRYQLADLPTADLLAFIAIPFISGLIVLVIGLAILWLRTNQPVAILAAIICFLTSIFMAGISDVGLTHTLSPLWLLATAWLGGAMLTLAMIFPVPVPFAYRAPIVRFVPFILSCVVAAAALVLYYNPVSAQSHGISLQLVTFSTILSVLALGGILLFIQRPRATSLMTRDQVNTMLIGVTLTVLPIVLWIGNRILQSLNQSLIPLSFEAMMPFFITPIVGIAYAVLQYRRVDTDRVISRGITYAIMLSALIIGYFLLVMGVSFITQDAIKADDPLLVAFTIFVIAALFIPVRTSLQNRIDEIYFRTRRNYQQYVEEFGQKLTTLVNYGDIIKEFRMILDKTIVPSNSFVFLFNSQTGDYVAYGHPEPETDIRFSIDSGVVQLLSAKDQAAYLEKAQPWPHELQVDRVRLTILRAMVLAGMQGQDRLNGFIIIGPSRSGINKYTFEEIRFINNLAGQLAVAVERAQVIDSLERRVRELDVLSQVGQAVNFVIEFDDLLELISAQTSKLVDAANFYIALHDPASNQLYFAFFLEEDERVPEKETQRWNLSNDLFSEVQRTSQPLRIDDFSREMVRRDAPELPVNPHLRAWMGVPLIAGPRTLGVIAVAKLKMGENYTREQFKIFNDIGALAATSLDKARLFAETNMRARQLTVLNDISRRLVSTELNVEALLEIITSSAADILNAEAGSLLLLTEDGSGDLEFKVVIGGSGQELIGSRIPAGKGVVGQVAKSGKSLISNDVVHDPRHAKVATGFKTNSLLAVPLIAKDTVIGVLEVLNKKDGTIFVDEDIELVTTFAGQAAVAIENAQRFSMTDIQLSERVKELEMLERIDTELNRTLDLRQVAEITLRWAIANAKAEAGALGIINGTPPRLQVVSIHGYLENEYPEGADSYSWPLDEGIVKRVMRTKSADIAPDIKIDPDYKKGLKGSLSQITVPMFSGDDINAIIILETNKEPRFSLGDWAFAQRLAEHASIAISNAQLYSELARANDSKSEFVSFVAHELKQPLASVKGYADLLKSGITGPVSDQQVNFLSVIRSNADRMQTLIDDLRDSVQAETNKLAIVPSPIEFRNVLMETLRPMQHQLDDKHQQVATEMDDDLPHIMGDQNRLIQVLTNLLTNAHKYSPPDTTITVRAQLRDEYRDTRRNRRSKMLQISVVDQGIGMSEEDLAKIFKTKYFRSENPLAREQPGTGLGMMITHAIIEGHGGEIWVESELGKGSTFSFVIPLAPEQEVKAETAAD